MPIKILYCEATGLIPYRNQAVEQYLLETASPGRIILYLWQNRRTVVIGRNQNCWQECRVEQLRSDGGFLARRMSGGGAVYHDTGNLNFTFIASKNDYDLKRQLEVILRAVQKSGIKAEISGRNDLLIQGRKFSGNAFYSIGSNKYHHGTLLVNSDPKDLSNYLRVSAAKLESKGVNSVRSRIINMKEVMPQLTVERLKEQLIISLAEVYQSVPQKIILDFSSDHNNDFPGHKRLTELERIFSSEDWLYGKNIPFNWQAERRFDWGTIDLQFFVEYGVIRKTIVYSDALEYDLIEAIPNYLQGSSFSLNAISACLDKLADYFGNEKKEIVSDIKQLLKEQLL